MDHQPVAVQRLGQRAGRVVEPDDRDHEQGQHEGDDHRAEPVERVAAADHEVERRHHERAREGELVHVAPRHPVGVRAHPAGDQGDEVDGHGEAREQQREPAEQGDPDPLLLDLGRGRRLGGLGATGSDQDLGPVDLPQRRPLDDVGEQGQEVDDGRGRDGLVAQRAPRGVGHARSSCRSATRSESTASVSPPPERSRAATSTRVPSGAFGDAHPDPAGADEQRAHQPEQREHDAQQRDPLARRLADLDPLPGVRPRRRSRCPARPAARRCRPAPGRPGAACPSSPGTGGRLRLVEDVDRLRRPGVQVEVAGVDVEREQRVDVVAAQVGRVAVRRSRRSGRSSPPARSGPASASGALITPNENRSGPMRQERHRPGRRRCRRCRRGR